MKQVKFLMAALALIMGTTFTSCNDSGDSGPREWSGIVKVNTDGSFSDQDGTILIPTSTKFINASMAYIYCRLNEDQQPVDPKKKSITLLAEPLNLDGFSYSIDKTAGAQDRPANAAIATLEATDNYYAYKPDFFNEEILILPLVFYIKSLTTKEEYETELKNHEFELICYVDEIKTGDTELNLKLNHVIADGATTVRDSKKTWTFKSYQLGSILREFTTRSGSTKPTKIVIHTDENQVSDKLSDDNTKKQKYDIEYTF